MNRVDCILQHINPKGFGLEIGPFQHPIAPKSKGYNVEIIDHLSREGLLEKYAEQPIAVDKIEEVDYVWQGESYAELTGKSKHYDWIIASHVIEHTPDLIAFINDCDAVLKDTGVLALAIPDKRYCFDHFRPITPLSQVIDSHNAQRKTHSPGAAADYFLNVVSKNGQCAWQSQSTGQYELRHSTALAQQQMINAKSQYIDLHAWCFVPSSFRLMAQDLNQLGLISLKEVGFVATQGCEFYISLSRTGQGCHESRLSLLKEIEQEIIGLRAGKHRSFVTRLYDRCRQALRS